MTFKKNPDRGRLLGPSRSQEVQEGDSLTIEVDAIFDRKRKGFPNASSLVQAGSSTAWKDQLIDGIQNLNYSPKVSPLLIYEVTRLVLAEIESKKAPESYLMYALYDQDSILYEKGKVMVSQAAANDHEQLRKTLTVKKNGFIETFVVNETSENVFFDNLRVQSTTPIIVQENSYYPFGMTIACLDYSYSGHTNRYLYNGKELLDDLNLNLYDFGARYFDPVIGRWTSPDPMASERSWVSPYNYVQNNPMLRIDPDGMLDDYYNREGQFLYRDNQETDNIRIIDQGDFDNIQQRFLGDMYDNSKSNVGLWKALGSESTSISGSGISAEAASNIFTDILDKAGFDVGKLHNGKVSVDGGQYGRDNFNDGSRLGYGQIASGQFKGQINPDTGQPYTYTGSAPEGTIKVTGQYSRRGTSNLTTVSNVESILGIHEFKGHGMMKLSHSPSDHKKIYMMQKAHKATFDKLTPSYRQHIIDMLKK